MKEVKVMILLSSGGDLWGISYDKKNKILRYWCDTNFDSTLYDNCCNDENYIDVELAKKFINSEYWQEVWDWFDEGDVENDRLNHKYFRYIKNTENLKKDLDELFGHDDKFYGYQFPRICAQRDFKLEY